MAQNTVLLAAELGAGLGHIMPLYRISEALHEAAEADGTDLRCIFAVHSPELLRPLKRPNDLVLRAPRTPSQGDIRSHTASYAEVLVVSGFSQLDDLKNGVANWDDLFALTNPTLLIADHSPTAVLAARGRVPTLVTGNGFTVPPAKLETFPALIAGRSAPAIQSLLLKNVNAVLHGRGLASISHLPVFLEGNARAIFSLPALDPYGPLRDSPLMGLYEKVDLAPMPELPRIFLYGHTNVASFPNLVRATLQTELPICAYLTGNNNEVAFLLEQRGAQIFDKAPMLNEVLPTVSLVVSNGGAGLSQACLMAGRPQIIAPIHAESQIMARNIERLGCAVIFDDTQTSDLGARALDVSNDLKMQDKCQEVASHLKGDLNSDPLPLIASRCLDLLKDQH